MEKKRTHFNPKTEEDAINPYPGKPYPDSQKDLDFIQLTSLIKFLHFKKTFEENYSLPGEKDDDLIYFGVNLGEDFVIKHGDNLRNHHESRKYNLFLTRSLTNPEMQFLHSKPYDFLTFSISMDSFKELVKPSKFKDYQRNVLSLEKLVYNNRANLRILNLACEISVKSQEGIQIIGKLYLLMDLIIEQYLQEHSGSLTSGRFDFKEWEIDALLKISGKIKKNPEQNFSVGKISAETGVSIPRLQAGFKEMHDKTVALYIKDVRLKQAEKLIRTTNYNISEVVYKIGLTSRSYFSRIFKEKYKFTPSEYKKNYFK